MSQDDEVPEAPDEPMPEETVAVKAIKDAITALVDDENLSLLERLYALESLREVIAVAVDVVQQTLDDL